jgi:hypothetical protein
VFKVVRQDEPNLIQAIHELSSGEVSNETIQFVKGLNRPSQATVEGHDLVKLFSINYESEIENALAIHEADGQESVFTAEDSGERKHLDKIRVPKVNHLWVACT